jgi:hypothetical protein
MQHWRAALVVAGLMATQAVSTWAQTPGSTTGVQSAGGVQNPSPSDGVAGLPGAATTTLPNVPSLEPGTTSGGASATATPSVPFTATGTTTATSVPGAMGGTEVTAPSSASSGQASTTAEGGVTPNENAACPSLGAALGAATSMPNNCIP